jgi:hypothetical protein
MSYSTAARELHDLFILAGTASATVAQVTVGSEREP